jgi:hypothetical protein
MIEKLITPHYFIACNVDVLSEIACFWAILGYKSGIRTATLVFFTTCLFSKKRGGPYGTRNTRIAWLQKKHDVLRGFSSGLCRGHSDIVGVEMTRKRFFAIRDA